MRQRLGSERAYSLVEMLTVISIMSVVLTGLIALFVQGTNAELDMNNRFRAQQDARVALDKLRREIHCARLAATTPATGTAAHVTLTLPAQCPTAVGAVETSVSWCTQALSGRYALYRKVGATCNTTGTKWADHLTASAIFQYRAADTSTLARLYVRIPIDIDTGDETPAYALCDQIVLRNSSRTGTSGTALPNC